MPEWTRAEANRMSKASVKVRRAQLRLQKKALSIEEKRGMIDLAKTALQSPVLAGTAAFIGVHFLEASLKTSQTLASTSTSGVGNTADQRAGQTNIKPPAGSNPFVNFLQTWEKYLLGGFSGLILSGGSATGGLAGLAAASGAGSLFDILKNLDFAALKMVILVYIATGGNLAGLLQSSGGLIEGLIKSAGVSGLGAAIAP